MMRESKKNSFWLHFSNVRVCELYFELYLNCMFNIFLRLVFLLVFKAFVSV